jgi:hypothetical protein
MRKASILHLAGNERFSAYSRIFGLICSIWICQGALTLRAIFFSPKEERGVIEGVYSYGARLK